MDHIPQPNDTTSNPFKVPFLAAVEYDGKGLEAFKSFPSCHGFDFESEDDHHSAEDPTPFIQSWLYFGLLAEFIGKPIDHSTFLHRETLDVSSYLAPKDLKYPLRPLKDEDDHNAGGTQDESDDEKELRRLYRLLKFAQTQCTKIDRRNQWSFKNLPVILLSIRVLIDTLWFFCGRNMFHQIIPLGKRIPESSLTKGLLTNKMISNGWCPFQIDYILRTFNSPLVCFISQICRPEINHEKCSTDACTAFNIDHKTYETRHEQDGCKCRSISIPVFEMRRIVHGGGIPIVFLKRRHNGEISLGVKASSATDSYVAFSHVWSDGLGNTKANALPECQLKKLARYLSSSPKLASDFSAGQMFSVDFRRASFLDRPKYFWIDTLCIPVKIDGDDADGDDADDDDADDDDADNYKLTDVKTLKQKAIEKITPTFARASRVIILDSELEHIHPESLDWYEISARVLFSAWMGRCWTLEEGALSRTCHIQFIHGSFDPKSETRDSDRFEFIGSRPTLGSVIVEMAQYAWEAAADLVSQRLDREAYDNVKYVQTFDRRIRRMLSIPLETECNKAFLKEWKSNQRRELSDEQLLSHFTTCWNALSGRQTSRFEDRVIILANLLDLNTFQVKEFKSQMLPIIRSLPAVPLSMLYMTGHRGKRKGKKERKKKGKAVRWLPLYPGSCELEVSEPLMTWTGEWLELKRSPSYTHLLLIDPKLTNGNVPHDLILDMGPQNGRYRVEFMRQKNDCLTKTLSRAFCLLIYSRKGWEKAPGLKLRGACLHVLDTIEERNDEETEGPNGDWNDDWSTAGSSKMLAPKLHVSAVYDCPLRILLLPREAETGRDGDYFVIPYQQATVPRWSLKMRHDCTESARLQTRPRGIEYTDYITTVTAIIAGPFFILDLTGFFFFIAITVTSFLSLPLIGKAAIILVFTLRFGPHFVNLVEFLNLLCLVGTVVYSCVKKSIGGLSRLDYFFVVPSIVGQIGEIVGWVIFKYLIVPRLYAEELSVFSSDWPTKTKLVWTERGKKAGLYFESVLERIFNLVDKISGADQ